MLRILERKFTILQKLENYLFFLLFFDNVKRLGLTEKEQLVLYGLVRYPHLSCKELAERIGLKYSTVSTAKKRLRKEGFYRVVALPSFHRLGCELLAVIYTNFSPLIPLEERVKVTRNTIEVFEEIFLSVGEEDKGFSLSFSKDYTTIGMINDIRTRLFGGKGLLEDKYPHLVIFPFKISKIYRFFDFSPLLSSLLDLKVDSAEEEMLFEQYADLPELSKTEKKIFCEIVENPDLADVSIGKKLGISRHTVSKTRRKLFGEGLIRLINIPNFKKLDLKILAFYHVRFDPRNPPDMDKDEGRELMSKSSIFMASRRFEAIMLSMYRDYVDYKSDKMRLINLLKERRWIAEDPMVRTYGIDKMVIIKDFAFSPLVAKLLG